MQESEDGEQCCEKPSSGHSMAVTIIKTPARPVQNKKAWELVEIVNKNRIRRGGKGTRKIKSEQDQDTFYMDIKLSQEQKCS